MNIIVRALTILLAIAFVVLLYYVAVWILGMLGLVVPDKILTIVFVIIGLAVAVSVLTGKFDHYWKQLPPS